MQLFQCKYITTFKEKTSKTKETIMKNTIIAILLSITFFSSAYAEEAPENLSLQKCLKFGIENNSSIIKANLEKTKSEFQIQEAISNGLPQIEGYVQSIDNIKKSVMILPGELLGKPGTNMILEYGTQYSTSAGFKINQLIYSQTYFLSLTVSKKLNQLNEVNLEKVKDDIIYDVSKMYVLASITYKQISLIENNISRLDSLISITKALVDNGYAKSVDLDRVIVGKSNLQIQLENTTALYKQQLNLMKYYIDLPHEKNIAIIDNIESLLLNNKSEYKETDIINRKELRLLELQKDLYNDKLKANQYGYLPTLSFFSQFQIQNMKEEYILFGTEWYSNSYIGLNLSIPIFDGFNKHAKISQAEIDLKKSEIELSDAKKYFVTNYEKANRDFETNSSALVKQKQNVDLAKNILEVSKTKLTEGNILMSDLLNDESNLTNAEQGYLNTRLQLIFSELDLLKSIGKLNILLNN